jgi:hypothetical protein
MADRTEGTYTPHLTEWINPREQSRDGNIPDISTAGSIVYFVAPYRCFVKEVYSVLHNAITAVDAVLTAKDNGGSSMGTITVDYVSSAVGTIDSLTDIETNNVLEKGEKMSVSSGGESTTACRTDITVLIEKLPENEL